ncbi:flavin-containing monooxygenase [Mycolicibacterium austroafricanum]|uniref:flavin-containing monooxygenase n=1 Tax=Mycolicibacterium austroafricanum TaxID=39687 RepID=UPI000566BE0E|nr:NAD(P)/FAD-dependent oxidoreductase [Mycolicibacterium austroafricanum]QZY44119.1 NAD(P)/FAD-dependent oxidoreductase [Mycolicibacterium austroafricanum]
MGIRVAIIGAGMSGLCMAAKLQDAGIEDFTVFEKADEVGGTWRDNTYPGLACDVPSRYYAYSFRPNPEWSHMMPPGPEVFRYFRQFATERGIRRHIRFGADVTAARFRDGKWWLTSPAGVEEFDVLVTATGFLRVPRYPDILGLDTFTGPMFHSSRWDHSVSLSDKRIGLIGTGSTGVQITSALGGNVRHLKVFQRTPQWICPWPNLRVSEHTKAAMRRWTWLNSFGYWFWGGFVRSIFGVAPVRPGWQRWLYQTQCHWNLRLSVRDKELKKKLTPPDQPMCKRMIFAGHYYRTVQRPDVEIVTDPIVEVQPRGVVTADGTLHEVDLLALATGFDFHAYVRPLTITGEHGRTLDDAWADGPTAYRAVAVPGFPNMFMLMGPHAPVGNNSLVPVAEDQADYVMWWIDQLRSGRIVSAAPTEAATKQYNDAMKAAMPRTVWTTGCRSWYLGKDGLPELFPWEASRYAELLRSPRVSDFDVRTAAV